MREGSENFTLDMTTTWERSLRPLLALVEQGDQEIRPVFTKMARAADIAVKLQKQFPEVFTALVSQEDEG